jgi:hypothetical protein
VAAVRYFMVKFSRGKVIAFDLGEALNFTGESGPYIQYAVVRANKIVQNLEERLGVSEAALVQSLATVPPAELDGANGSHEVWALVARGGPPRRRRRAGDPHARVLGAGEVGVLARPELQRLLSHRPHPERRARRRAALARGRGDSTSAHSSRAPST